MLRGAWRRGNLFMPTSFLLPIVVWLLLSLVEKYPAKILSVQVDGGAEFRKDPSSSGQAFEDACKELEIPLIVLPPKSPKKNGGVERAGPFH